MKRRAFITKTALATVAAPLLPVTLAARPLPGSQDPRWRCEWRPGANRVHVIETDSFGVVLEFLSEHPSGELKIWLDGKVEAWCSRPIETVEDYD